MEKTYALCILEETRYEVLVNAESEDDAVEKVIDSSATSVAEIHDRFTVEAICYDFEIYDAFEV